MNRLFAQIFAFCIGAIHLVVLLGLGLALVGVVLDMPQSVSLGSLAENASGGLPAPVVLGLALIGYVLVMGVVSTLIAINQNLERLARDADRRGGYDIAAARDGIEAGP